jgi:hypothetical protein
MLVTAVRSLIHLNDGVSEVFKETIHLNRWSKLLQQVAVLEFCTDTIHCGSSLDVVLPVLHELPRVFSATVVAEPAVQMSYVPEIT